MRFVNLSMHVVNQIVLSSKKGYVIIISLLNSCALSDLYIITQTIYSYLISERGANE